MEKYNTELVYRNQLRMDELQNESRNAMINDITAFMEEHGTGDYEHRFENDGVMVFKEPSNNYITLRFMCPIFYGYDDFNGACEYTVALRLYPENVRLVFETDLNININTEIPFAPLKNVYDDMEDSGCFKE